MKKALLTYILTPAVITVLMLSCSGGSRYRALLDRADSLMAEHPDSAYALLTSIDSADMSRQRKAVRMRYELQRAEAQNKLYLPFTTDSVLREVVRYYDSPWHKYIIHFSFFTFHSASNEALKSRYLLGCAYRDLHEAPVALLTWEEAIAAADTTAADCDYATLSRVYGQMSEIYKWQHLPEMQLKAQKNFSVFALLAGDTLHHLRGQLLCNSAYYALGDTAAIFANSEAVRKQYLELGLTREAARVYPTPIHVAVDNGQYERARKMMDEYEQHSGLFDSDGFITDSTRAQYHSYKGRYFLGVHEIDSAEMQFRKIMHIQRVAIDAYRGLIEVYRQRKEVDSIQKYSRLFECQAIRALNNSNSYGIIQAQGMYDYSRQERIAMEKERSNRWWKSVFYLMSLAMLIVAFIAFYHIKRARLLKILQEQEYENLESKYTAALEQLGEAQSDVSFLRQELEDNEAARQLLRRKEVQIIELKNLVGDLSKRLKYSPRHDMLSNIKESDIIERLHTICKLHFDESSDGMKQIHPRKASNIEWDKLNQHTRITHPGFFLAITERKLSELEFKVCLLVRYGFKNPEISTLTGANKRSISNVRKKLAVLLFGSDSARDLDNHLLSL